MAQGVLQFVIVGQGDHPLFEADLAARAADAGKEVRLDTEGTAHGRSMCREHACVLKQRLSDAASHRQGAAPSVPPPRSLGL